MVDAMSLRIAFDLDGVLADFAGAYDAIGRQLFADWRAAGAATVGDADAAPPAAPRSRQAGTAGDGSSRRRRNAVLKRIRSIPDFWQTLDPIEPDAISRLQIEAVRWSWETFFVTQRMATAGDTVQRQTQHWLVGQGFALPSVIVHAGARGRLAAALELDYLVDDRVDHCVDTVSASAAAAIVVDPAPDEATAANLRRLGIAICAGPGASLDLITHTGDFGGLRSRLRGARRRLAG